MPGRLVSVRRDPGRPVWPLSGLDDRRHGLTPACRGGLGAMDSAGTVDAHAVNPGEPRC